MWEQLLKNDMFLSESFVTAFLYYRRFCYRIEISGLVSCIAMGWSSRRPQLDRVSHRDNVAGTGGQSGTMDQPIAILKKHLRELASKGQADTRVMCNV